MEKSWKRIDQILNVLGVFWLLVSDFCCFVRVWRSVLRTESWWSPASSTGGWSTSRVCSMWVTSSKRWTGERWVTTLVCCRRCFRSPAAVWCLRSFPATRSRIPPDRHVQCTCMHRASVTLFTPRFSGHQWFRDAGGSTYAHHCYLLSSCFSLLFFRGCHGYQSKEWAQQSHSPLKPDVFTASADRVWSLNVEACCRPSQQTILAFYYFRWHVYNSLMGWNNLNFQMDYIKLLILNSFNYYPLILN